MSPFAFMNFGIALKDLGKEHLIVFTIFLFALAVMLFILFLREKP